MPAPKTYSFLDTQASIQGPGGVFSIGAGVGVAEEGITVEPAVDQVAMTIGADGQGMHSLIADESGSVTLRLLKTSPTNAQLMAMYNLQKSSSSLWGQNTLTIVNTQSGDNISCDGVAFTRKPSPGYTKEGPMNEWKFNATKIDMNLGAGV